MDVEVNTQGGEAKALGDSNVGHKLLSLMGWAGGGLGRDGEGRAEPVTATTVFGREGLGTSKFYGRYVQVNVKGGLHLELPRTRERYSWSKAAMHVHNVISGRV